MLNARIGTRVAAKPPAGGLRLAGPGPPGGHGPAGKAPETASPSWYAPRSPLVLPYDFSG